MAEVLLKDGKGHKLEGKSFNQTTLATITFIIDGGVAVADTEILKVTYVPSITV